MKEIDVLYQLGKGAVAPTQGYEDDFAYDMYAAEGRLVPPRNYFSVIVPTNLKTAFDPIAAGLKISLRSGVAVKTPLAISNSPGIVEGTYRDGIGILVRNTFIDDSLVDFVMTVEGKQLPVSKVPKKVLQEARRFYDKESEALGYAKPTTPEGMASDKVAYRTHVPRGTVYIAKHDRIAQMHLSEKIIANFKEHKGTLPASVRGENKFGSSGTSVNIPKRPEYLEPDPLDEVFEARHKTLKQAIENAQQLKKKE